MSEGKLTMFGKTFNTVGSTDNNLVLQTKGDLKIRWGNKFIDLIKNGKINADSEVIKSAASSDNITKDGIYYISKEEGEEIWVCCDGHKVNVTAVANGEYISYINQQTLTPDLYLIVLHNIGFIFDTVESVSSAGLTSGIVFVLSDSTLYTINNGILTPYGQGLVSSGGSSISDPLKIGEITIYGSESRIVGSQSLSIGTTNSQMVINDETITVNNNFMMKSDSYIVTDDFISNTKGYKLYYLLNNGLTMLEIDNVYIRNELIYKGAIDITYDKLKWLITYKLLEENRLYCITDFQNEWEISNDNNVYRPIICTAISKDKLSDIVKFEESKYWQAEYDVNFYGTLPNGLKSKGKITKLTDEYGNSANFDFKHKLNINNKYTFDDGLGVESSNLARNNTINIKTSSLVNNAITLVNDYVLFTMTNHQIHDNYIDYLEGQTVINMDFYNNTFKKSVINSTFSGQLYNCVFSGNVTATFSGIIHNCEFRELLNNITITGPLSEVYIHDDLTTTSATKVEPLTGWTLININPLSISVSSVPKLGKDGLKDCYIKRGTNPVFVVRQMADDTTFSGMITMFNGYVADIPEGWVICNGLNGTPNLTDRFIKAVVADVNVGANNNPDLVTTSNDNVKRYIKISAANLPAHSHYYSLSNTSISTSGLTISVNLYSGSASFSDNIYDDYSSFTGGYVASGSDAYALVDRGSDGEYEYISGSIDISHTHTASISGNLDLSGITITLDTTREATQYTNTEINIEPLAYALLFIMKL